MEEGFVVAFCFSMLPILVLVSLCVFMCRAIYMVNQTKVAVISTLGKFRKIVFAGIHFKIPIIHRIEALIDLTVQSKYEVINSITKDGMSVQVGVAVLYRVCDAYKLMYANEDPIGIIGRETKSLIITQVSSLNFADLYTTGANEKTMSVFKKNIHSHLSQRLNRIGCDVDMVFIPHIDVEHSYLEELKNAAISAYKRQVVVINAETERQCLEYTAKADSIFKQRQAEGMIAQTLKIDKGEREAKNILGSYYDSLVVQKVMKALIHLPRKGRAISARASSTGKKTILSQYKSEILT